MKGYLQMHFISSESTESLKEDTDSSTFFIIFGLLKNSMQMSPLTGRGRFKSMTSERSAFFGFSQTSDWNSCCSGERTLKNSAENNECILYDLKNQDKMRTEQSQKPNSIEIHLNNLHRNNQLGFQCREVYRMRLLSTTNVH